MGKKVGLLGGTFDPVHLGHIQISKSFLQSGYIDELWVLLTPFPPHKLEGNYVPYNIRKEMLDAAFDKLDNTLISTLEDTLSKPSYTINTILELKKQHPDHEFFFCLGEDSLAQFHTWKYHDKILDEVELLAAFRPGASHDHVGHAIINRTIFIDHEPSKISSTEVRHRIKDNLGVNNCVPEEVLSIIRKYNLYKD